MRGGSRPGAGRPKRPIPKVKIGRKTDPLAFLLAVMNDNNVDARLRIRAAVSAAQYMHAKKPRGGKKQEKADKAHEAGAGKFGATAPPKLTVVN